jgi:hypothetical protein
VSVGANLTRYTQTVTIGANTASIRAGCFIAYSSGQVIDVTIDIAANQLELGASATSPILPPVDQIAVSSRAADDLSMTDMSWYSSAGGVVYVDWSHRSGAGFPAVVSLNNGTVSNRINIIASTTTGNRCGVVSGGTTQADLSQANYVSGTRSKGALAFAANNFRCSFNGASVSRDTSGSVPAVTQLELGRQTGGLDALNGLIYELAFVPMPSISDGALQRLTR